MMRRAGALFVVCGLIVYVSACGGSSETADTPGTAEDAPAASPVISTTAPVVSTTALSAAATYETIETALGTAGLSICRTPRETGSDFSGAYEGRSYNVMVGACPSDPDELSRLSSLVVVDLYNSARVRNESLPEPFGDRLVCWGLGSNAIVGVTESTRPEVIVAVEKAMTSLRATKGYDGR